MRSVRGFSLFAVAASRPRRAAGARSQQAASAGPPPALKLPAIQKRQLSNGLPVWIVELHEVPVAQVNLVVLSGSADDPAGKFGVASLTAAMLTEGAGLALVARDRRRRRFPRRRSRRRAAAIDSSAVRLHVPVARLADALPIMADVALRPTFPKDELERLRQQRLTSLLQARDDPATIASLAFSRVLYGAGAPLRHGRRWARRRRSRRSPPTICARSTRRRSGPTTPRCSSSAT